MNFLILSTLTVFTTSLFFQSGASQSSNLRQKYFSKNRRLLVHHESKKCLTVSETFSLTLEKCNFDLPAPLAGGVFQVVKSNAGGHLMKWASRPIPGAIEGCIQVRTEKSAKPSENDEDDDDEVKVVAAEDQKVLLGACDTRDPSLNWEFSRATDDGKYLVRKLPSGPCLAPVSHDTGAVARPVACDASDADQLWRICENLDVKKCDP